jgi:glycosyltransferase involved in cell wall biosynthesis
MDRPRALVISPESPDPAVGGGPLRTASIVAYLRRDFAVDVLAFREDNRPVRAEFVIDLPHHSRSTAARAARNLRRFALGRPPLADRYSGFERALERQLAGRRYAAAIVEHFWCAPYAPALRSVAGRLVLDLHNVESALQQTGAESESWPVSAMFRRFGSCYRALEREWLPRYDDVLVTSEADAARVRADARRITVVPNTLPELPRPDVPEEDAIVFSGNLEYQPNVAAVRYFAAEIWPILRARHPGLEWRLAGRNPHAVERYVRGICGVRILGPVDEAVATLARAKAAVVPLQSGSGTRFKILEAWAAARAVISTPRGAEGLDARDGEHLLIAQDPAAFADAVTRALASAELRGRIGECGRRLYLARYTTGSAWRALDTLRLGGG